MSVKEMGQVIIQKIHEETRKDSAEFIKKRKAGAEAVLASQTEKYHHEYEKHRQLLQKQKDQELEEAVERRSSALNRELLNYLQQLYHEIFELAVAKLRAVSDGEFHSLLEHAIIGVHGDFVLYLGELTKDKLKEEDFVRIVSGKEGLNMSLSADTIPNKSGFLFADESIEYNCLFEDLMEEKKDEQAASILKEVFFDEDAEA